MDAPPLLPSMQMLNPAALVPAAQPRPEPMDTTPSPQSAAPGASRGLPDRRRERRPDPMQRPVRVSRAARARACTRPVWTPEGKKAVEDAIRIGILRFEDDEEKNEETGGIDVWGIQAKFHMWEFHTYDDLVDFDSVYGSRIAKHWTTDAAGDRVQAEKRVSYTWKLFLDAKNALKGHKDPAFIYSPPDEAEGRTSGIWFCEEVQWPQWLHDAVKARADFLAQRRADALERAEAEQKRRQQEIERARVALEARREREREQERARVAALEAKRQAAQAARAEKAAREAEAEARTARRRALEQQFRDTRVATEEDKQWYRETFKGELEAAVTRIILTEHNDRIKSEFARIPASSIAKAPALVDERLVPLEQFLLDVIAASVDKIVEAFRANNLDPVLDAIRYTAKARTRLSLPELGECVTLYVRTQPSKASNAGRASADNETGAVTWSLLFDQNSSARDAVNASLLARDYQHGVLKGGEQIQVTSVHTLRGALNGLWTDVFAPQTKANADKWNLPRPVDEAGENPAFKALLPSIALSDA